MSIYDDNEKNDFFEDSNIPEKPKPEKKPRLTPDNPQYWEEPEGEYDHLQLSRGNHLKLWIGLGVVAVIIGVLYAFYLRLFNPYIEDAVQYGYVERIDKRGETFKTFEGVILPYKNLMDTTRVYDSDIVFSTTDDEVAARLLDMQFANRPVRITYRVYHTALPWRGESKLIVTAADSVNERDILPPDRNPSY